MTLYAYTMARDGYLQPVGFLVDEDYQPEDKRPAPYFGEAMDRFNAEQDEMDRRLDGVKEEDDFVDDEIAEEGEFELVDEGDVVNYDDYEMLQDKLELIH